MEERALEREALRNVIRQWNANRLDLFELSEPNEELGFHGVMRFYFQDSGQKVATKCIRVASDATVSDVVETLVEKFRPDMRMLSVASYALYELHLREERKLADDEKPLLVQLNWHLDDREGRFLLRNVQDVTHSSIRAVAASDSDFKRKLSKREKKELKRKEKLSRIESNAEKNSVAEKLYTELPETSFTRSISNPEAVMRRRRQQKEKKLQQFRSKDGGPDTGGTLKIYGESLCPDVPYKTLLLSVDDCSSNIVREMLDKYGLGKIDPQQYCLVQVNAVDNSEYVLDDDECPLSILMTHQQRGSIMFHVRRRPADCQPRRRKKKSGSARVATLPLGLLQETQPDGATPAEGGRTVYVGAEAVEVGSANGATLQLYGPSIQPRHCVLAANEGVVTLSPLHADAHTYVDGQRIYHTTVLQHGCVIKFDRTSTFRFVDPSQENKLDRRMSQSQTFDSASVYDRSPTSPAPDDSVETPHRTEEPDSAELDRYGSPYDYKREADERNQYVNNNNNNNNIVKMDGDPSQQSKSDFASPYGMQSPATRPKTNQYKDNYETTFDLDGNVETKSICSAKSGGSGHEARVQKGQEAILPAVLEFPEHTQHVFLQNVISKLDVNSPAFKLAPVYTLYLCARYRASTHYRPELTPTERAHKLTTLLHHIASLIQDVMQEKYVNATFQAFWMANSSELLHFLKCDRHISAFTVQAQDILANTVQAAFSNLVGCFHMELTRALATFLKEGPDEEEASGNVIGVLSNSMALLRQFRVNAALTIQLFSQLFHYINVWCFNKVITSPHMMSNVWGSLISARLAPIGAWAESQGLEIAADGYLALIHQCAHLLQAPKSTPEDIANLTSSCFKLNSVQLRCLLSGYFQETNGIVQRLPVHLVEAAVKHAQGVADELHRADGRDIVLEENISLPLSLLIPEDGFSAEVVRGLPCGLAEFLTPLQRAGLCRLAPQPHSLGHWTVYMTGYNSGNVEMKPSQQQQPVVEIIQLQKNSNGIGLSIVAAKGAGQSKLGIYIKSVVPGGAAAADQRLQAGDQLLAVDGYSLVGITQERAAEHLVRTGPIVTLHVAKQGAVLHGLATLLRQPSPQPNRGGLYLNQYGNRLLRDRRAIRESRYSSEDSDCSQGCDCVEYSKYDFSYCELTNVPSSYSCPYFETPPVDNQKLSPNAPSLDSECSNSNSMFDQIEEIPFIDDNVVSLEKNYDDVTKLSKSSLAYDDGELEFDVDSGECLKPKSEFGIVKTIADRFNKINLTYQCSQYGKKSLISLNTIDENGNNTKTVAAAQSLSDVKNIGKKYTKEECEKMLLLLEDWSKNGSSGKTEAEINHFQKTQSDPNISVNDSEPKPAIEKKKLFLPRKKFPESYIVKRKSVDSNKIKNRYQSCPDLLGNFLHSQYAWFKYDDGQIRPRRMSERDLPSKVEMEPATMSQIGSTVKTSKSVPALHEHVKQNDVFNPGYSRTSSNNSISAATNMKGKNIQNQTDQNSFYQNLSIYQNSGLGDRLSNVHNSQSNLQLPHKQAIDTSNQRPQSAYYGNQSFQMPVTNNPNLRAAQSTKDLAYNTEAYGNQVKTNYPSMPNVNQGYSINPNQSNTMSRLMTSPNQYNNHGMQMYGNQNYSLRGQAKLAEMSEEVKRRQQRGVVNAPHMEPNIMSPTQQKRLQFGAEGSYPMSPVKQQPPVAPKPQVNSKRDVVSHDIPEGPVLPPPSTHPLHQQSEEDAGYLASSSDPPAVSFYPTHRQMTQPHFPPNPWEREEREKEMEARRVAARVWRDQQIASLQSIGEDRRTPQQEQQLRALTLERDFERRAQETQVDEEDKETKQRILMNSALHMANNNFSTDSVPHDLNLASVSSNIVSSVQPISLATSNINNAEQQSDSAHQENKSTHPIPSIQPKSILKSNLKLDNLNSNSPQSPSKTQKNASFSANLTPQSLKFDNVSKYDYNINNKLESKYDTSLNNKYEPNYTYNPNQLAQSLGELYVNSSLGYSRSDNVNSNVKFESQDMPNPVAPPPPPPPERGSSFTVMSQQQALRTTSQPTNLQLNNNFRDKRVSFHDKDGSSNLLTMASNDNADIIHIPEDPDRFITEAENMLHSPSTPTGPNITHTPGVIGAQEVYRDPRQKRLAEQQKAQQAEATPIPEKLSFKEKMKMFALESGESNTPKDKVKISRAQRDIDAVH